MPTAEEERPEPSSAIAKRTLVLSQVVLSFGIPFALIPLVRFTSQRALMGALVNRVLTTVAATVIAALIVSLNAFLIWETFVA